jgi:putative Ca2+/H+ antiporter (TMEM165/GDT1 family)
MDWKLVGTTFVAVFVAELGDKTQLATLSFAGSGQSRLSVFLGSALALVLSSAIAVTVGEGLARAISPLLLQRLAGALFLVIGCWVLWSTRS